MRHKHARNRLRQKPAHSRSLQRNLITSLVLYESIRTTKKRAEVVQPIMDTLITTAKKQPAHIAIRSINRVVTHKNACRKTMEVLRERFADRTSGFTRMTPLGSRGGDGAQLVTLAFVEGRAVEAKPTSEKIQKKKRIQKKSSGSSASSKK